MYIDGCCISTDETTEQPMESGAHKERHTAGLREDAATDWRRAGEGEKQINPSLAARRSIFGRRSWTWRKRSRSGAKRGERAQ
jgi:hypothetical protein